MKSYLNHPYIKIAGHTLLLFFLLYYCIILAAAVYPYDDGWRISLLKCLPVFALVVVGWLYFFRFKVLNLTYRAIAIFSCILFIVIYYPFFPIKSLLDIGPRMTGGNYGSHLGVGYWIYNIALTLNKHVLIWSPYIFFVYFLLRGLNRRCPKCKLVNGIYARRELRRESRGSSTRHGTETSETRRTHYNIYTSKNETIIERETRHVTYTTYYEEVFCDCKVCQHNWSYNHSHTVKS